MNKILRFNIYSFICGVTFALMLCGLIYFGSRGLKDFDPALRGFALTTVLGAFALGYRLFTWLQRPPSWIVRRCSSASPPGPAGPPRP